MYRWIGVQYSASNGRVLVWILLQVVILAALLTFAVYYHAP